MWRNVLRVWNDISCFTLALKSRLPTLLPSLPGSKNYSWIRHAALINSEESRRTVCCQLQLFLPSAESERSKLEIKTEVRVWNDFDRITIECGMETFQERKAVENAIIRRSTLMMRRSAGINSFTWNRPFRHLFGVTPKVASILCMKLVHDLLFRAYHCHLLWCLMFLRSYSIEHVNSLISDYKKNIQKMGIDFSLTYCKLEDHTFYKIFVCRY